MLARQLATAIQMAATAHLKQADKAGMPYILHCIEVMNGVHTNTQKCIAILHDIIENTAIDAGHLKAAGIPVPVVEAVELLTRDKKTTYDQYIDELIESDDVDAMLVKMSDLTHNMDLNRLNHEPDDLDLSRKERYLRAYDKIKAALESISD